MDIITGLQRLEFHQKLENHQSGSIKHYNRRTGNRNWLAYSIRNIYLQTYITLKKQFKHLCLAKKTLKKRENEESTICPAESVRKKFWNNLKSKSTPPPTSQITLAEWENHFDTLYSTSDTNLVAISINSNAGNHDYAFSNWNCPEELNENIELYEIVSELHCTPNSKAAGPDRIT